MKTTQLVALLLFIVTLSPLAKAADIVVNLPPAESNEGQVVWSLYSTPQALALSSNPQTDRPDGGHGVVPASTSPTTFTIPNIPAGTYALGIYQDKKNLGHVTRVNGLMPDEYFGFSECTYIGALSDPMPWNSDTTFQVTEPQTTVNFKWLNAP